jgi:hypothetical protein
VKRVRTIRAWAGSLFLSGLALLCGVSLGSAAPAQGPAHVKNFTFWKQSGIATTVPAAWMAAHVTFVETGRASDARDFRASGGQYSMVYTDPNYYFVSAAYRSHGDFPESAFGHDATGARISRPQGDGVEYYLVPNAQTRDAYRRVTLADADDAYDYAFADGVSDSLHTSLYRMSAPPVEIHSDAEYIAGMKAVLAASARPMIINGYDNGEPLGMATYVTSPNIAGVYGEACLATDRGAKTGDRWIREADALLFTTAHQRFAFCGGHGNTQNNQAGRLYWLASWWLTFDPDYSVAVEVFESPGDVYVFPESQLVPTSPIQNAASDINALRTSGGAYVREFRQCYETGRPIGPCAALVNPSATPVTLPPLSTKYSRSLTLDARNLFDGGQIGFAHSVPTTLAPGEAAIIFL